MELLVSNVKRVNLMNNASFPNPKSISSDKNYDFQRHYTLVTS